MGVVQVTSNLNNLTMKFFVLLAAIGAASAASSNAVTCDECQQGAAALVDHLLTSESLDEQAGFIKALVCPETADPAACEAAVDMWFADMATASTTTLSSMVMSAPDLVFARRPPSSPHVTGLARSAPTFLPELLTTCPILPLLMKELHTFRETASVARMDTLTTALTPSAALFHLPCQFLPRSSLNRPLSFAKKLLVFAKLPI